ncbi:hypothetical protein [Devosia aurantiaca]|uniref:Uncharacterized protein n=1 Tax=Devosia aurantiaca TaxID=2714858 RepID=A0A6M1SP03_9HYPH|nr:hypothetical protein [Devosia aurantiaca]NGP18928.1 hypothetical protein [Devosia aurantiaca]
MKTDRSLTFVEIDIPYCALRYGEGACTAQLGVDSPVKCFNTFATCAKRSVFSEGIVTLRFAKDAAYLGESGIDAIPSIVSVNYDPARLSLGEKSLGARAKLSVTFRDHPYGDTGSGFDKYRAERPYDPAKVGSFWGKLRARHPILNGRAIRLIRGVVGQGLEEMETRHLMIDGLDTAEDGRATIVGKDVLKLADGDRALAPKASNGYLLADISTSATSFTLGPSGIGNKEYPASGYLALGGKEIVSFTRSNDAVTIVRAQFETTAKAHRAQDRAQLCLNFLGVNVADILATLFQDYAGIPASQIPLDDWREETNAYLRRVYTALIAEPTPVRDLAAELVEQAALALIPDDIEQRIKLQVLRSISTDAGLWSEENIGQGSLRIKDKPEKRITNCVTYYGLINPLENVTDAKNYRSIEAFDATDFDVEDQPRIKRIYSRWIPAFGRTIAARLNLIQVGRYSRAPRQFSFDVFRNAPVAFGGGYRLSAWPLQLPTGERESVPIQVVSLQAEEAWQRLDCEEARFIDLEELDLNNRVIVIDGNAFNLNFRTIHDGLFPPLLAGDTVTFVINSGVIIGSHSTSLPAINLGAWPAGFVPAIRLRGGVRGKGGAGGNGGSAGNSGGAGGGGGTALYARHPFTLELFEGASLWGGGGGGGGGAGGPSSTIGGGGRGGGGGGGAGVDGGSGGGGANPGRGGSPTGGGNGGNASGEAGGGRSGGNPGNAGDRGGTGTNPNTNGGNGGVAGAAIDGNSYSTKTGPTNTLRGRLIN